MLEKELFQILPPGKGTEWLWTKGKNDLLCIFWILNHRNTLPIKKWKKTKRSCTLLNALKITLIKICRFKVTEKLPAAEIRLSIIGWQEVYWKKADCFISKKVPSMW